jgi:hypothetical protein
MTGAELESGATMTQEGPEAAVATDPMSDQAPNPVTPPAPARRSARGWFLSAALAGVVCAGAGGAAIYGLATAQPGLFGLAPQTDDTQITALKAEIARLSAEVKAIPAPVAPDGEAVEALGQKLEAATKDLSGRLDGATATVTALTGRVARLESQPVQGGVALPADLVAQTQAAQDQAKAAEEAARALQAAAGAATRQAAVSQILAAVDSGAALGPALALLEQSGGTVPAALKDQAAGVPTLASLRAVFPDAARAGLSAALAAGAQGGFWARTTAFLQSQTGARSLTPREGSDPDAILSRVEAALAADDLATVEHELSTLPQPAQDAMADWRATVARRAGAQAAVASLMNGG